MHHKSWRHLINWRPTALLNVDYNKRIASRLLLLFLFRFDFVGFFVCVFIRGRFVGETTRIIYDVMEYCKINKVPDLLLTINFEFFFLKNLLESNDFGNSLRKWIELFFNICSTKLNIENVSDCFWCERGCRRGGGGGGGGGGGVSPYLFILCVELLSHAVKRNKDIRL